MDIADALKQGRVRNQRQARRKAMYAALVVLTFLSMWAFPREVVTYVAILLTAGITAFEVDKKGTRE